MTGAKDLSFDDDDVVPSPPPNRLHLSETISVNLSSPSFENSSASAPKFVAPVSFYGVPAKAKPKGPLYVHHAKQLTGVDNTNKSIVMTLKLKVRSL
jgi:hypothetical protein